MTITKNEKSYASPKGGDIESLDRGKDDRKLAAQTLVNELSRLYGYLGVILAILFLITSICSLCLGLPISTFINRHVAYLDYTSPWKYLPARQEFYSGRQLQAMYNLTAANPESRIVMMQHCPRVYKHHWQQLALLDNHREYASHRGIEYALDVKDGGKERKIEALLERIESELAHSAHDRPQWIL